MCPHDSQNVTRGWCDVDSGVWCTWCGAGMVDTWTQDLGWRGKAAAALGNTASA